MFQLFLVDRAPSFNRCFTQDAATPEKSFSLWQRTR